MTDSNDPDVVDEATKAADEAESHKAHVADSAPTPEEEKAAEAHEPKPGVAEHAEEMNKLGANAKGEGQI